MYITVQSLGVVFNFYYSKTLRNYQNYVFIIGRRKLQTNLANLAIIGSSCVPKSKQFRVYKGCGASFLHRYCFNRDPDSALLETLYSKAFW